MSLRTTVIAASLAAFGVSAIAAPASAGYRHRNHDAGAAAAIGIGALIVGGIIASQSRRHKRHHVEEYRGPRHYQSYRYAPAPRHYGHAPQREYMNDH
jgi:hypothetical protein